MSENIGNKCLTCGLPPELCVCEDIAKESQGALRIYTDKRRFGKMVTLIEGIKTESAGGDIGKIVTELKKHCACGGSYKEGEVMLQGDQFRKAKELLKSKGFVIGN